MSLPDEMKYACDSCHYHPVKTQEYTRQQLGRRDGRGKTKQLCHICANTLAGNAIDYPDQYPTQVLSMIAWVGNYLAALIEAHE